MIAFALCFGIFTLLAGAGNLYGMIRYHRNSQAFFSSIVNLALSPIFFALNGILYWRTKKPAYKRQLLHQWETIINKRDI